MSDTAQSATSDRKKGSKKSATEEELERTIAAYNEEVKFAQQELVNLRRRSGRHEEPLLQNPKVQESTVKVDHTIKLKPHKYDGSTDWVVYFNQFEKIANVHNWDEGTKEFVLHGCLEGEALSALSGCFDPSYREMTYILNKAFGPGEEETAIANLQARRLKKDETLEHLARDIKRLVRSARPHEDPRSHNVTATEYFIKALPDPHIRVLLKDLRVRDVDEAVTRAQIFIANRESEQVEVKTSDEAKEVKENSLKLLEEKISQLSAKLEELPERAQKSTEHKSQNQTQNKSNYYRGTGRGRGYRRGRGRSNFGRGRGSYGSYRGTSYRGNGNYYGRGQNYYNYNRQRDMSEMICYNCGMRGHIQMYCPLQRSPNNSYPMLLDAQTSENPRMNQDQGQRNQPRPQPRNNSSSSSASLLNY